MNSEEKTVKITCEGAELTAISTLCEFQGELKSLSDSNYYKLRKQILELGFSFPFHVWKNDNVNFLLDGHQRLRTLRKMESEGWTIPLLPINIIYASDRSEAKRKLLAAASQYGKVERQGLYEFMSDAELPFNDLDVNFSFPEIDLVSFHAEYFDNDDTKLDDLLLDNESGSGCSLSIKCESEDELEFLKEMIHVKGKKNSISFEQFRGFLDGLK